LTCMSHEARSRLAMCIDSTTFLLFPTQSSLPLLPTASITDHSPSPFLLFSKSAYTLSAHTLSFQYQHKLLRLTVRFFLRRNLQFRSFSPWYPSLEASKPNAVSSSIPQSTSIRYLLEALLAPSGTCAPVSLQWPLGAIVAQV
jgi:hypothetical protein